VQTDLDAAGESRGEVVALEHLGHGGARREADHVHQAHPRQPLAVAAHLEVRGVGAQDLAYLGHVGRRVGVDGFAGEDGPSGVAAGGVTDPRRVVADDEHGAMTPVLELADHAQRHRVAQGDVGRRRVHPELDPERCARPRAALELGAQVGLGHDLVGAAGEGGELLVDPQGAPGGRRRLPLDRLAPGLVILRHGLLPFAGDSGRAPGYASSPDLTFGFDGR
jgi:hypothetical protein